MDQGLIPTPEGARALVHAPAADLVELCLFDSDGNEERLSLDPSDGHHTLDVGPLPPGQRYGFRTHGPWAPEKGLWHHPDLLLVDPFARAISGDFVDHPSVHHDAGREDSAAWVPKSVFVEPPPRPRSGPRVPWSDTVIYETHVRGLTITHPEVSPELRGTFLGAASEPVIDHLLRLGVTSVELMPVAHHVTEPILQRRGLTNYWGYSTLGWLAPHGGYATGDDGRQVAEFATMVDRFHAAGLEVILDVVFNHTAEGGLTGAILSMKGLDNPGWYRLDGGDYVDWTGTGNTIDTSNPRVRQAILSSLRWWAEDLGVDGFRFDLGVTLGRDHEGHFSPIHLEWLSEDPVVGACKLIAEPWDLGPHGYQLGNLGGSWREWNARFRDDVRDVWRGRGNAGLLAARLGGSPDVFGERAPEGSIELITSHDGFTLADLVAYDHKHNEANREDNRDGHDDNRSWNSGVEGPTDDPTVLTRRRRRSAALLTTLMLGAGVPMLLGGDELGRSKGGNNNTYPLEEPNWYDWEKAPLATLISNLTDLRHRHPGLRDSQPRVVSDDPVLLLEIGAGDYWIVANPTDEDRQATLGERSWKVLVDSAEMLDNEQVEGTLRVPAWTLMVLCRR